MGNPLNKFDLRSMCQIYNVMTYVETGTGEGNSLKVVLTWNELKKIYTVDIDSAIIASVSQQISDERVSFIHSDSLDALKTLLNGDLKNVDNVLFFLDAHFPQADYRQISYEESIKKYGQSALPLKSEINLIAEHRSDRDDIIIIDDLRIYKDGPFQDGNWNERLKYNLGDESFIYEAFPTKFIQEYYTEQGFIMIAPQSLKDYLE